ncbi:iron-containing redox enzyme family protein [Pseudomonas typographi]|uniref:iron-containing redox enzyme family protein n=1 Tax=Pseudomonas typographi TaxID=2715964 RepID=UPI001EEE20A5|nr:iron-containing redox enzyme family protein [Pseudomonas typographi]
MLALNPGLPAISNSLPHPGAMDSAPPIRAFYEQLLYAPHTVPAKCLAAFLDEHLQAAQGLPCDLPADAHGLEAWVCEKAAQVGEQYARYLARRHAGGGREYFGNKAHALYFLQQVAPTKLVDGAWLYGTVRHAHDWRYDGLLRTYLEELGDGEPAQNHVVLYRQLLEEHDCQPRAELPERNYLQGALQLALGEAGEAYLPEAVGYNLGYEQLPLHLLITSFELNELGIDPYYFTLHVTIDNASSGHARKAAQAVLNLLAPGQDPARFLARVARGYQLNELGHGARQVIGSFDLEAELVAMFERKRLFGQCMHSDYCKLEGRTVNEWLGQPGQVPAFLDVLMRKGWIKRGEAPEGSRFWQLIDGTGAAMFGVFDGYEKQLVWDWIAEGWQAPARGTNAFRWGFRKPGRAADANELRPAERALERTLAKLPAARAEEYLLRLLAPAAHATPDGLAATRLFRRRYCNRASL